MSAPVVRVLIVEDFAQWRRELRGLLEGNAGLKVVGEAETGIEAIQQAADLAPDLMLLDLCLPLLNGIDVAKRIFGFAKPPRIIFVSENRSREIAQQAFRAGVSGYVVKSNVQSELLRAIDAVLEGRRFVSEGLHTDSSLVHAYDEHPRVGAGLEVNSFFGAGYRHEVAFYENDADLEAGFAEYARATIQAQKAVLVIASETHGKNIFRQLMGKGIDLEELIAVGRYHQMEARAVLSKVIVNHSPDPLCCQEILADVMRKIPVMTNGTGSPLTICAECAPMLLMEGNQEAAMALERCWDDLTRTHSADTLCGYSWSVFPDRHASAVFQRVCAEHTAIHRSGMAP